MNTKIVGEFSQSETKICFISGGHRQIISPFCAVLTGEDTKRSVGSRTFQIGEHSWQIVCYPNGETSELSDHVSLFLGYRGPDKECFAHWRLTLVNQDDPSKNRTRAWCKGDKFNTFLTGRRWGWQRFIRRDDLMDSEKGFIKDGTVVFEASLDVYLKQTQTIVFEEGFDFDLYPVPTSQVNTDFGTFFNNGNILPSNGGTGALADVRICFADKREQYAHSQILSARSPVFLKLFTSALAEGVSKQRVVDILVTDVEKETFLEVLRYIYTGKVNWEDGIRNVNEKQKKKRLSGEAMESFLRSYEPVKKKKKNDTELISQSVDLPSSDESEKSSRPHSAGPSFACSDEEDSGKQVLNAISSQMKMLHFALSIYETADKYELNRLRLIAEHKLLETLKDQVNRINNQIMMKTQKFYEITRFMSRKYGNKFCTTSLPYKYILGGKDETSNSDDEDHDELWSNGFMDVLAVADRHNSTRLKRLCFSVLTSDAVCKRTKRKLLSDKLLQTLSKSLVTDMLQYVAIREPRTVDEEQIRPQFGILGGVPESGKEWLDEKDAYDIEHPDEREPSHMPVAELQSELVERGFPIRGSRAALVARLEAARGLRVLFRRPKKYKK